MPRPRLLGVLLCYNDGDFLPDAIEHLLHNNHDVLAWNHGSTDDTADVLRRYRRHLVEATDISRSVDFYDLYPLMSKHLLANYVPRYDWISWPDQDELLEGPTREQSYAAFLDEAFESPHSWIEFNDLVDWFTDRDDPATASPAARVRYYSLARHGPPKVRSWRATATNIRWFNHNRAEGSRWPRLFNLRHYPMRAPAQMQRRLAVDRAGIQNGPLNCHYENMKETLASNTIRAEDLHYDDGRSELSTKMIFDWKRIYGTAPKLPGSVLMSYFLSTKRWEIASLVQKALLGLEQDGLPPEERAAVARWIAALDGKVGEVVTIAFEGRSGVTLISEDAARELGQQPPDIASSGPRSTAGVQSIATRLGGMAVTVTADPAVRSVRVEAEAAAGVAGTHALLALVPTYGGDRVRITRFDGRAEFSDLRTMFYYLTSDADLPATQLAAVESAMT